MDDAQKAAIAAALEDFTVTATYIPFHLTPDNQKDAKLSYRVVVQCKGRTIYSGPYTMGIAHIPGWKHAQRMTIDAFNHLKAILADGKGPWSLYTVVSRTQPILPDTASVIHCLVMDGDAIDYTFEDWCSNYGYDTDSMKAKSAYDTCLQVGLALRQCLGDQGLAGLREAFQDF